MSFAAHGVAVASPQRGAAGAGRFGKTISSENPSKFNVSQHRVLSAEASGSTARCIAAMSGGHFGETAKRTNMKDASKYNALPAPGE